MPAINCLALFKKARASLDESSNGSRGTSDAAARVAGQGSQRLLDDVSRGGVDDDAGRDVRLRGDDGSVPHPFAEPLDVDLVRASQPRGVSVAKIVEDDLPLQISGGEG
jgi:hypothetical protein